MASRGIRYLEASRRFFTNEPLLVLRNDKIQIIDYSLKEEVP